MIAIPALAHEGGGEVEIARRERVIDGRLDRIVRPVPGRGSQMEGRQLVGLAGRELALQEVPQQGVVAKRPSVVVDQQGRACELRQDAARASSTDHRVAERRRQSLEDRCAGHEFDLGPGVALQDLEPEVVRDDEVGTCGDRLRPGLGRPRSGHRQRKEGRPPFGLSPEIGRRFGRQPQPEFPSEPDGLPIVHRELGRTECEE